MQIYEKPRVQYSPNYTSTKEYLWTDSQKIYSGDFQTFRKKIADGFSYIPQFARYSRVNHTTEGRIVNLLQVIGEMKSDRFKVHHQKIIEAVQAGDQARKKELKESLPYITHSGIFIPRNNASLTLPGFTYQLDIDKISNTDQIIQQLIADDRLTVLFATVSTSGRGVKALLFLKDLLPIRDTWHHEQYKQAYHQATDIIANYFKTNYGVVIDTQMKAISQPFFLFYAPQLFINKNYNKWILAQ